MRSTLRTRSGSASSVMLQADRRAMTLVRRSPCARLRQHRPRHEDMFAPKSKPVRMKREDINARARGQHAFSSAGDEIGCVSTAEGRRQPQVADLHLPKVVRTKVLV